MARIIGTDGGQTVPGGKAETLLPDSTSRDTFTCIFRVKRLERIRLRMQGFFSEKKGPSRFHLNFCTCRLKF